jgi:hypothetical protein
MTKKTFKATIGNGALGEKTQNNFILSTVIGIL